MTETESGSDSGTDYSDLRALFINCSLKRSPEVSNTQGLADKAIAVMEAQGVHVDVVRAADVVITMGCGDACPVFPGKRYLDWPVADPAGQPLDRVREIRDDIDGRVRGLLSALTARG